MKTLLFSVFDSKAGVYGTPFFMSKEGMAIRAIVDLVNNPDTLAFRHPEDFSLFRVGSFDDETGSVISENLVNLGSAASFKKFFTPGLGVAGNGVKIIAESKEVVR